MSMNNDMTAEQCKDYIAKRLNKLVPLFARFSVGDFSRNVPIADEEDEFTEFFVGIQTIIEVVRDKMQDYEELTGQQEKLVEERTQDLLTKEKELLQTLHKYDEEKLQMENSQRAIMNILEDYRDAKEKSEESTKLKEAFLANMSHEIRTPMNSILGFSDLLAYSNLPKQEKEYVNTIKIAGENLLNIINDILDISKIESGIMGFEDQPFSVEEIFKSLSVMLAVKAQEKNIGLLFRCDDEVPHTVFGDASRLTQVLINLIHNAIKFTEKGKVEVLAKIHEVTGQKVILRFSVTDTGIGVAAGNLESIFERFRQAEAHTTRKYGGTGLGLSIARQLVELQGGSLTVTSEPEKGSVFSFTIPYKISEIPVAEKPKPEKKFNMQDLKALNILMMEDNKLNIKLMNSLFTSHSLQLTVAENGQEGVEKLTKNNFDLVLMDVEMPVMNGYDAATYIRKMIKSNIPIIAMTAHVMAGEREKCLSLGMNDYISKPVNTDLLFEKIHTLTLAIK